MAESTNFSKPLDKEIDSITEQVNNLSSYPKTGTLGTEVKITAGTGFSIANSAIYEISKNVFYCILFFNSSSAISDHNVHTLGTFTQVGTATSAKGFCQAANNSNDDLLHGYVGSNAIKFVIPTHSSATIGANEVIRVDSIIVGI